MMFFFQLRWNQIRDCSISMMFFFQPRRCRKIYDNIDGDMRPKEVTASLSILRSPSLLLLLASGADLGLGRTTDLLLPVLQLLDLLSSRLLLLDDAMSGQSVFGFVFLRAVHVVIDDRELLVLHHQSAVLPLHDLQPRLALAMVAVGLLEIKDEDFDLL